MRQKKREQYEAKRIGARIETVLCNSSYYIQELYAALRSLWV